MFFINYNKSKNIKNNLLIKAALATTLTMGLADRVEAYHTYPYALPLGASGPSERLYLNDGFGLDLDPGAGPELGPGTYGGADFNLLNIYEETNGYTYMTYVVNGQNALIDGVWHLYNIELNPVPGAIIDIYSIETIGTFDPSSTSIAEATWMNIPGERSDIWLTVNHEEDVDELSGVKFRILMGDIEPPVDVPEPSTYILLATMALLPGFRNRKRKTQLEP